MKIKKKKMMLKKILESENGKIIVKLKDLDMKIEIKLLMMPI
jgi:hypothetical protein